MPSNTFILTEDHLKLLKKANIDWRDSEAGAPGIDSKRPYGNGYVAGDVAEILGWRVNEDEGLTDDQESDALEIHRETEQALQIVLRCYPATPGAYVRNNQTWKPQGKKK